MLPGSPRRQRQQPGGRLPAVPDNLRPLVLGSRTRQARRLSAASSASAEPPASPASGSNTAASMEMLMQLTASLLAVSGGAAAAEAVKGLSDDLRQVLVAVLHTRIYTLLRDVAADHPELVRQLPQGSAAQSPPPAAAAAAAADAAGGDSPYSTPTKPLLAGPTLSTSPESPLELQSTLNGKQVTDQGSPGYFDPVGLFRLRMAMFPPDYITPAVLGVYTAVKRVILLDKEPHEGWQVQRLQTIFCHVWTCLLTYLEEDITAAGQHDAVQGPNSNDDETQPGNDTHGDDKPQPAAGGPGGFDRAIGRPQEVASVVQLMTGVLGCVDAWVPVSAADAWARVWMMQTTMPWLVESAYAIKLLSRQLPGHTVSSSTFRQGLQHCTFVVHAAQLLQVWECTKAAAAALQQQRQQWEEHEQQRRREMGQMLLTEQQLQERWKEMPEQWVPGVGWMTSAAADQICSYVQQQPAASRSISPVLSREFLQHPTMQDLLLVRSGEGVTWDPVNGQLHLVLEMAAGITLCLPATAANFPEVTRDHALFSLSRQGDTEAPQEELSRVQVTWLEAVVALKAPRPHEMLTRLWWDAVLANVPVHMGTNTLLLPGGIVKPSFQELVPFHYPAWLDHHFKLHAPHLWNVLRVAGSHLPDADKPDTAWRVSAQEQLQQHQAAVLAGQPHSLPGPTACTSFTLQLLDMLSPGYEGPNLAAEQAAAVPIGSSSAMQKLSTAMASLGSPMRRATRAATPAGAAADSDTATASAAAGAAGPAAGDAAGAGDAAAAEPAAVDAGASAGMSVELRGAPGAPGSDSWLQELEQLQLKVDRLTPEQRVQLHTYLGHMQERADSNLLQLDPRNGIMGVSSNSSIRQLARELGCSGNKLTLVMELVEGFMRPFAFVQGTASSGLTIVLVDVPGLQQLL